MQEYLEPINRVAGHYRSKIEELGLELRHSTDFELFMTETERMGFEATPHFAPRFNAFYRDEAFWAGVYDNGKCVATVACKRQPLGSESLASYAKRSWTRYYTPDSENPVVFQKDQKPFLERMRGTLCYCGEYRVLPKFQKQGIGQLMAAYIKPVAWSYWPETDLFYIFMENKDVRSGLMAAIELTTQIKNALQWVQHPSQAKHDYWLGAINRSEFLGWLKDELRSPAVQAPSMLPEMENLLVS